MSTETDMLHGREEIVHADAGYTGAGKRVEREGLEWEIAIKHGTLATFLERFGNAGAP